MDQSSTGTFAVPLTQRGEVRIERALMSVSDKRGLPEFANGLTELGIEIISTGGTANTLTEAGVANRPISNFTGFPEIMDGRVKTLHPKLHAGLLAVRDNPEHMRQADEHGVELIDLVCVSLYPFEETIARGDASFEEVIEQIDIGGPTMIRAAAKNFPFVAVIVRPESYDAVLAELREHEGKLSLATRENLAAEAFAYTARYEAAIARWFAEREQLFPSLRIQAYEKAADLRYGENPHQSASYYVRLGAPGQLLQGVTQHAGKELSYNNLLDLDAARQLVHEFEEPACVIVKHNNPCGVAIADDIADAYTAAFECDPMSAFGGVICFNRPVTVEAARRLKQQFFEIVYAPGYEDGALDEFSDKKDARVLEEIEYLEVEQEDVDIRQVLGGLLVQRRDHIDEELNALSVVSKREPSEQEHTDLVFAWKICKHVRSNAIVIAKDGVTLGIGAGQMSRVDAVRFAIEKAQDAASKREGGVEELQGAVLASDAFFPFPDGPQLAIDAGVKSIIQPGGSIRDEETTSLCDATETAQIHTGVRHFRH